MKNQVLFSLKDKSKKIKMSSAAIFVWCYKGSSKMCNIVTVTSRNLKQMKVFGDNFGINVLIRNKSVGCDRGYSVKGFDSPAVIQTTSSRYSE